MNTLKATKANCATYDHKLLNKIDGSGESEFITLKDGILTIRRGYSWDGASGPSFDTPSFRRAALVHDALYQLIREGCLPRECKDIADKELHDVCIMDGMSRLRAWYVHKAVQRFGRSATINHKQVIIAP